MDEAYKYNVFPDACLGECPTPEKCACKEKKKAALEQAHKIRRFEISLYWQRSLYFWGFQTAFFAAYALILGNIDGNENILAYGSIAVVAVLGFFVSVLWRYLAKGSKAWQENWENHIDQLEDDFTGRLYKTVLGDEREFYSVTRINQLIICAIGVAWLFLLVLPGGYLLKSFVPCNPSKESICLIVIAFLALVLIVGVLALIMASYRIKSSFPDDGHDTGVRIKQNRKIKVYFRWN